MYQPRWVTLLKFSENLRIYHSASPNQPTIWVVEWSFRHLGTQLRIHRLRFLQLFTELGIVRVELRGPKLLELVIERPHLVRDFGVLVGNEL